MRAYGQAFTWGLGRGSSAHCASGDDDNEPPVWFGRFTVLCGEERESKTGKTQRLRAIRALAGGWCACLGHIPNKTSAGCNQESGRDLPHSPGSS